MTTLNDYSLGTVLILDQELWHRQITEPTIRRWSAQFSGRVRNEDEEQALALAALSHFMFFGEAELRVLSQALFQEHLWYPLAREFRQAHDNTIDEQKIERAVRKELDETVIVGPGNPSESAAHLLYHFRVSNDLPLGIFSSPSAVINSTPEELGTLRRLVMVDDLCGTGKTAAKYRQELVEPLREKHPNPGQLETLYLTLFGTVEGLRNASEHFTARTAMFIDDTYKAFGTVSRYFRDGSLGAGLSISRAEARTIFATYGEALFPEHPLGYGDCQLLLGFAHNIPNNTLPVLWSTGGEPPWQPIFPRYGKRLDWE